MRVRLRGSLQAILQHSVRLVPAPGYPNSLTYPYPDVRVHHCYLSVLLYRIAIIDGNSTTSIESYAVTRLELFSSCLEALRAMFNQLFASPPEHMPLFPHAFWIQAAHSLMILVHLPLCPAAALGGFDTKHVESVLSYLELIGTLGARFSEAQRLREERYRREGLDVELPWMFTAMQARIRSLKDYYIQHQLAGAEEPGVAFDMTVNPLFLTGVFPDDMFSFY